MIFGVILYLVFVTVVLAVLFLAPVRVRASACLQRVLASGRAAGAGAAAIGRSQMRQAAGSLGSRSSTAFAWTSTNARWIMVGAGVLFAGPLIAIALRGVQQLDGYDHTAARPINEQIAALLHGEQ